MSDTCCSTLNQKGNISDFETFLYENLRENRQFRHTASFGGNVLGSDCSTCFVHQPREVEMKRCTTYTITFLITISGLIFMSGKESHIKAVHVLHLNFVFHLLIFSISLFMFYLSIILSRPLLPPPSLSLSLPQPLSLSLSLSLTLLFPYIGHDFPVVFYFFGEFFGASTEVTADNSDDNNNYQEDSSNHRPYLP